MWPRPWRTWSPRASRTETCARATSCSTTRSAARGSAARVLTKLTPTFLSSLRPSLPLCLHYPPPLPLVSVTYPHRKDRVKIAGFGLARSKGGVGKQVAGHPRYAAPEVLAGQLFAGDVVPGEKADVFSFALVVYEIWEQRLAWKGTSSAEVPDLVKQGQRPDLRRIRCDPQSAIAASPLRLRRQAFAVPSLAAVPQCAGRGRGVGGGGLLCEHINQHHVSVCRSLTGVPQVQAQVSREKGLGAEAGGQAHVPAHQPRSERNRSLKCRSG